MIAKVEKAAPAKAYSQAVIPAITGLVLVFFGPFLPGLLAKYVPMGFLGGELCFWGITLALFAIVKTWERQSLSSIGFRRLSLKNLAWAIGLGILIVLAYFLNSGLLTFLEVKMPVNNLLFLSKVPVPILFILALRAGVTEEVMYRGFAMERLLFLTRNRYVAAAVPLLVFIVSHLSWGAGHLVFVAIAGSLLTAMYLWKRNLWINIVGHFLADFVLFLLIPYSL